LIKIKIPHLYPYFKRRRWECPENRAVFPSVTSSVIPSSFRHFPDYQSISFDGCRILPSPRPIPPAGVDGVEHDLAWKKHLKKPRNPAHNRVPGTASGDDAVRGFRSRTYMYRD